ncbi:MAG: hypothetical protein Q4E47_00480 [Candidatus Saccharibacteria bacterium]|nr:hypothetical protein [Candidatus Saccharibacteria bacterium]
MTLETYILEIGDPITSLKKQLDQGFRPGTKMTIKVTNGKTLEMRVNLESIEKDEKGNQYDFTGIVSENYTIDIIKVQCEAPIRGHIYTKQLGDHKGTISIS